MDGKIDIHNVQNTYDNIVEKLQDDDTVIAKNRDLILKFLRDAELGKPSRLGQKRRLEWEEG